jgi:hypothetical protein
MLVPLWNCPLEKNMSANRLSLSILDHFLTHNQCALKALLKAFSSESSAAYEPTFPDPYQARSQIRL